MSKKSNVKDIVNERKNELDYSPLFQSKSTPTTKSGANATSPSEQIGQISQQDASKPENQNAGIPANKHSTIPESQHSSNLEIQHNVTATEKVTYKSLERKKVYIIPNLIFTYSLRSAFTIKIPVHDEQTYTSNLCTRLSQSIPH